MTAFILFFLLFLLPFVIAPFGVTQFENPKVILAEVGIILLFLFVLFQKPNGFFKKSSQFYLLLVIIFLTIIDLIFFKTSISFFGNAFRMQGIFLLWLLLVFSYLSTQISLKKIPWYVILLFLLLEVVATLFLPLNESQRYVGTLGEPNATAAFMLFLWPFLWFSLKKDKWWKILVTVLGISCVMVVIYLTNSRSALIGFVIQLIFLCLMRFNLSIKKAVIICVCLLFASYGLLFFQKDVLYENRLEVWTAGFYAGLSHPIIGGGFGNSENLLHEAAVDQELRIRFYYIDSAHNIFLDWWTQGGIIGLAVLCVFIFNAFKNNVLKGEKRNIALLLGILTALSFNPASVIGLIHFWWLMGNQKSTGES